MLKTAISNCVVSSKGKVVFSSEHVAAEKSGQISPDISET